MEQQFMIPANTKKSQLIFNIFRTVDLIIFGTGVSITLLLLFVVQGNDLISMFIKLAPVIITGTLVLPIPNYHNVLVFMQEMLTFYNNRRVYIWKGWCASYGDETKSK